MDEGIRINDLTDKISKVDLLGQQNRIPAGSLKAGNELKDLYIDIDDLKGVNDDSQTGLNGDIDLDFKIDFAKWTLSGNVTSITPANLERGKPIVRVIDLNGNSLTFGSEFKESDNFVEIDNTAGTLNIITFLPIDITSGSELIIIFNETYTP